MNKLDATTKPNGAGRNWLEIGQFVANEFGDKEWKPSEARYPHRDPRLKVKRDYQGRGASQQIHWQILIPTDYDLIIYRRSGDKRPNYGCNDEVLWQPEEAAITPIPISLMPEDWEIIVEALPTTLAGKIREQLP